MKAFDAAYLQGSAYYTALPSLQAAFMLLEEVHWLLASLSIGLLSCAEPGPPMWVANPTDESLGKPSNIATMKASLLTGKWAMLNHWHILYPRGQ